MCQHSYRTWNQVCGCYKETEDPLRLNRTTRHVSSSKSSSHKCRSKGIAELQDSSMMQPQQVTTFPSEHHIRVCACFETQFAFFRMSHTINLHPLRGCPQFKTIPTTASTRSSSAGKCYVTIETQTSTGSSKAILCHYPKTPLPSG